MSDEAHLPAPPSADYLASLKDRFARHQQTLSDLSDDPLEETIRANAGLSKKLGDNIIEAVVTYLAGHPSKAYQHLEQALGYVNSHVEMLRTRTTRSHVERSYRVRVSPVPAQFERPGIFHVPIPLRGLVASQRFSISGLPCLYLGGSPYVCWEELGRPRFSDSYVAQFRFVDPAPDLMDLSYIPQYIPELIDELHGENSARNELKSFIVALAICWPLSVACMTRVNDPQATFKAEYIVPQLLLQWLTQEKKDVLGIQYFSTHVGTPRGRRLGTNLVLPVRTPNGRGFCSTLSAQFEMTPVWNWEIALACGKASMRPKAVDGSIEATPGEFVEYMDSDFWKIEAILNNRAVSTLT